VADERGLVGVLDLSALERELAKHADKLAELAEMIIFPHVHSDQGA